MVVEEEEKERESEGGLGINRNEWKSRLYPGEIIATFEKDERVGKANKFEELEKWWIQYLQKLHFERKKIFFKELTLVTYAFASGVTSIQEVTSWIVSALKELAV